MWGTWSLLKPPFHGLCVTHVANIAVLEWKRFVHQKLGISPTTQQNFWASVKRRDILDLALAEIGCKQVYLRFDTGKCWASTFSTIKKSNEVCRLLKAGSLLKYDLLGTSLINAPRGAIKKICDFLKQAKRRLRHSRVQVRYARHGEKNYWQHVDGKQPNRSCNEPRYEVL